MGNMAIPLAASTVVQHSGVVERVDGRLVVSTVAGRHEAQRAVSCLVEPEPGDRVLVTLDAAGRCYVLAILEREAGVPQRVMLAGDTEFCAPAGRIGFAARDGLSLSSPQSIEITSNALQINANEGQFVVDRATYTGSLLRGCVASIKLAATSLDMVLDRFTQHVRQSLRRVDELEQLRARQIDHQAQDTLSLHGNNTMVTAGNLVKVDGKQIHVG